MTRYSNSVDMRRQNLLRRARGEKVSKPKSIPISPEILKNLPREEIRKRVRAKVREVSMKYVDENEPVGILSHIDGRKGFILQRSHAVLKQSCTFCLNLQNAVLCDNVFTALLCESCRVRASESFQCPGTSACCEKTLWVCPLGLPSTFCRACDRSEQVVTAILA